MSINSAIKAAVEPIVNVCVPHMYKGTEKEYCTFNYTSYPANFADNSVTSIGYSVQVHYCLPLCSNPSKKLKSLSESLISCGFDYPRIVDATDEAGQHYVLETGLNEDIA